MMACNENSSKALVVNLRNSGSAENPFLRIHPCMQSPVGGPNPPPAKLRGARPPSPLPPQGRKVASGLLHGSILHASTHLTIHALCARTTHAVLPCRASPPGTHHPPPLAPVQVVPSAQLVRVAGPPPSGRGPAPTQLWCRTSLVPPACTGLPASAAYRTLPWSHRLTGLTQEHTGLPTTAASPVAAAGGERSHQP